MINAVGATPPVTNNPPTMDNTPPEKSGASATSSQNAAPPKPPSSSLPPSPTKTPTNTKSSTKKKLNFKTILGAVVLLIVIVGGVAGFYMSQQSGVGDTRQQASGGWCDADDAGTDYGSPCSGSFDCGADGKQTVCQGGTWHATGNCCGSAPPPGSDPTPTPDPNASYCAVCSPKDSCETYSGNGQTFLTGNVCKTAPSSCSNLGNTWQPDHEACPPNTTSNPTNTPAPPTVTPVPSGFYIPGLPQGCCRNSVQSGNCPTGQTCDVPNGDCDGSGATDSGESCRVAGGIIYLGCANNQCVNLVCDPSQEDCSNLQTCTTHAECQTSGGTPTPPVGGPGAFCPNDSTLPAKKWVKFTCPNGCSLGTDPDGVTAWRCYENRQDSDSPLYLNGGECGQVDVLSGDADSTYCGYTDYNCDQAQCQNNPTNTPPNNSPTPTTPHVGPACNAIDITDASGAPLPNGADAGFVPFQTQVRFTCGSTIPAQVDHYAFKLVEPDGNIQHFNSGTASNLSPLYPITQSGSFTVMCAVCTDTTASSCQQFEDGTTTSAGSGGVGIPGPTLGFPTIPPASISPTGLYL